jgi:DNA-binding response OmpR family regulator
MQEPAEARHGEDRVPHIVPARESEPSPAGRTSVVLVTDDDSYASELYETLDRHSDFAVLGVMAHASTAVTFTSRRDPGIVIVDLAMSGLAEESLIRQLRSVAPTTIIVAVQGTGSIEEEADVRGAGVDLYAANGVPLGEVIARLVHV